MSALVTINVTLPDQQGDFAIAKRRTFNRRKGTSIHPRVVNGRTKHKKSNTASTPDPNVARRKIAAYRAHLEEHPYNKVAEKRLAKLEARYA